ncbi:hypothetical protein WJX72_012467 [[Myrmecia] bisecta]|uniref:Gluconokinase n=1 Tax=[Myrmecia] bisecta TaxID=41462 RepID=A0AAW1PJ69_9CHLO
MPSDPARSSSINLHHAVLQRRLPRCYVVTGVSGSGKSTVGKLLANRLQCPFHEGDDYHPPANIAKMRAGIALTDDDRWPWLHALAGVIQGHVARSELGVVSCSALKQRYRDVLCGASQGAAHAGDVAFVLLQPSREELQKRLVAREAAGTHFMPAKLLESQLAALEVDPNALFFDALPPDAIVEHILQMRQGMEHGELSEKPAN